MMTTTGLLLAAAIKASSFGFDPADSTEALQKAINASAEKVIIDRQAGPWIVRPLFLRNGDKEIVIEDGVEIRAKAGEYQSVIDTLLSVSGAKNVTIRGEGSAAIVMNKKDYQDATRYKHSEWRHTLAIRDGARNVSVSNLTLRASGGDGVYVLHADGIRLENVKFLDHHRQGISVISGSNLLARNCDFSDTEGTAPACGIDFEPNAPDEEIVNNVFENCRFNNNQVSGICFHLVQLADEGKPVSIVFRDCEIRGNREFGIAFTRTMRDTPGVTGFVLFERCSFVGNGASVMNLKNLSPEGLRIGFRDCLFDARATKSPALVFNNGMSLFDFGAVAMRGCRLVKNPGQETATFQGAVGAGVIGTKGVLDVEENGAHSKFDLAEFAANHKPQPELRVGFEPSTFNAKELVAPKASAPVATPERPAWCWRYEAPFVQYVPAAGEYEITILALHSRNSAKEVTVELSDAIGTNLGKTSVNVESGKGTYVLKTNGAGYYQLHIGTCGSYVDVRSTLPGHGFIANNRIQLFGCPGREYFFRVLPGTEDIRIEMVPDQGEPGQFQLVSPSGEVVADTGIADYRCILAYKRTGAKAGETWSVRMPKIQEDCRIRLGKGLVPVLSDSREAVVTTEESPAEVKASSFGFDPADSTAFLQAALKSGAKRVVIDKRESPWLTGMLKGVSNVEIVFEPGAVIAAKPGAFASRLDRLLTFRSCSNVVIRGGTLRMNKAEYRDPKRNFDGGYRHALELYGVENVTVEDMTIEESGGDGIYVNGAHKVVIRNVTSARNARQGISVISARDLLIERCRFIDTVGTPPQAGIDLEPNGASEGLSNILIRDCEFSGNRECGIDLALVKLNGSTRDTSIVFENCRAFNNGKPSEIVCWNSPANAARGVVTFRNCRIGYPAGKEAFRLLENEDLPIRLELADSVFREEGADGSVREIPFDAAWLAKLYPLAGKADETDYPKVLKPDWKGYTVVDARPGELVDLLPNRFRYPFTLAFYAAQPGEAVLVARQTIVGRGGRLEERTANVMDESGKVVYGFSLGQIGTEPTRVAIPVRKAGFYRIAIQPGFLTLLKSSVPLAVHAFGESVCMNGMPTSYYLSVPEKSGEFAVYASGDLGEESIHATVRDPDGVVAWDADNVHRWRGWRSPAQPKAGLWRIDLTRPSASGFDDYKVEMSGLPPFLFLSAEKYWK